jgi:hypothetical protein
VFQVQDIAIKTLTVKVMSSVYRTNVQIDALPCVVQVVAVKKESVFHPLNNVDIVMNALVD